MSASRLQHIDDLVKELSFQDDPDRLIRVFNRQGELLFRRDGLITVNCRDLEPPLYRISRSWRWHDGVNPWAEPHRLPVFDRGLLGELLYAGRPAVIKRLRVGPDDPAREHLDGMGSLACAPAYDRGRPENMVMVLRREAGAFTDEELETLLLNANLLGRAATNLQLSQRLQEAYRRLDQEMEQVGQMQRHLLPTEFPSIEGLELASVYVTCSRAGGDYYDVLPLPDGRWGILLADVSGHGTAVAVVMAMMHTLLHARPGPPPAPRQVLGHINGHLLEVAPEGMFATAIYGVYDPPRRRLRYAVAGHPPPRLRRGSEPVRGLESAGGLPLAVLPEESWTERELELRPGDVLLLYTDGIIEGANGGGEPFGRERLDDALRLAPLRAGPLVKHIDRCFREFCEGVRDNDDRTLLALVSVP